MASLADMIAAPGVGPRDYQTAAPNELFGPRGLPVESSADLERVLALPRREPVDLTSPRAEALIEHEMRKWARDRKGVPCDCKKIDPNRDGCIERLLPVQAWYLYEVALARGIIASVPVGGGKTGCHILTPLALGLLPKQEALLLVPANLVEQIILDYELVSQHFRVPRLRVHNGNKTSAERAVDKDTPLLRVFAYTRLSRPDASDRLNDYKPDAIIADECDALKGMTSTRTMRVLRYMNEHPDTLFCGATGSLTDHSIVEFHHLAVWALRENTPMPINVETAKDWDRAIGESTSPCPPGALLELCEPDETVRSAFHRRLAETRGFIMAPDSPVIVAGGTEEVKLVIRERPAPDVPQNVLDVLASVREGIRPDSIVGDRGDEILVDAMAKASCAQQVAAGLLYHWTFPRGESEDLIDDWYGIRKEYNSYLRDELLNGAEFLDSPKLLEQAAMRAWGDAFDDPDPNRPHWKCPAWPRWRDTRDKVEPLPKASRLSDFLVTDAIEWAENEIGVVWYAFDEFAKWMRELSAERSGTGIPVFGGGDKMAKALRAETGKRSIIVSFNSRGRGWNGLQFAFSRQLYTSMPASDRRWQQGLGRMKRRGQKQLQVETSVYLHTEELVRSYQQAQRRGEFVGEITRERRHLLDGIANAQ